MKTSYDSFVFEVDDNIDWQKEPFYSPSEGKQVIESVLDDYTHFNDFVASSCEEEPLCYTKSKDVFFHCLVDAFNNHRPFVLSPDMIWLIICQEFSYYVNKHAEELRDKIVEHDGKLSLIAESDKDVLTDKPDWTRIFDTFAKQISENTKGNITQIMTANFSTTTITERIASQITLMDAISPYFEFVVHHMACGIPFIEIRGNSNDWQRLKDKTSKLSDYGLDWWVNILNPILTEFINAASGNPNQKFWQDIVSIKHPDSLRGVSGYEWIRPSKLDGWILKFFPFDHEQGILESIEATGKMNPELMRVPFKYVKTNGIDTEVVTMELWAGFIGFIEDQDTFAVEPKIGWIVRKSHEDEELKAQIDNRKKCLELCVKTIPDVLKNYHYLNNLTLYFEDKVFVPDWFDKIKIKHLYISGIMTDDEMSSLKKRFPKASFRQKPIKDEKYWDEKERKYEQADD